MIIAGPQLEDSTHTYWRGTWNRLQHHLRGAHTLTTVYLCCYQLVVWGGGDKDRPCINFCSTVTHIVHHNTCSVTTHAQTHLMLRTRMAAKKSVLGLIKMPSLQVVVAVVVLM